MTETQTQTPDHTDHAMPPPYPVRVQVWKCKNVKLKSHLLHPRPSMSPPSPPPPPPSFLSSFLSKHVREGREM